MTKQKAKAHRRSAEEISEIMRRVRSTDTAPEQVFRKALWGHGVRYRLHPKKVPGKPDLVIPSSRLAIFIDGDFWHGLQWRKRDLACLEDQFQASKNKDYWARKIRRNMARDCRLTQQLLSQGWTVLRFWESDIERDVEACVKLTLKTLAGRGSKSAAALPEKSVAEFFSGIGLMRMGLEWAGWRVVFANDLDPRKRDMYQAHFRDAEPHFALDDIHKLNARAVPSVALATASFPCNDLSLAGSRSGLRGSQSSAFWGFVNILRKMGRRRPPIVLIENVPGFLTSHGGKDLADALTALNGLGYSVDAFILDAARFLPQSRARLFVVGVVDKSRPTPALGDSEATPSLARPLALVEFIRGHAGIRWRLRPLPEPPERASSLESVLADLPHAAPEWWNDKRAAYLLNQMSERHRALAARLIAARAWSYSTVFRRVRGGRSMAELRADGVAGCLRTPRGGSGRQILFKAGKGEYHVRLLTPRECARLMGADDFAITAPANQALFGFGDAVCVPVIEWIATYYLDPLVNEMIHGRPLRGEV